MAPKGICSTVSFRQETMERTRKEKAMIGARLREARERAKVTKEEAAEAASVQTAAVTAWERGTALPTLIQFKGLLPLYGVMSYQVLFGCMPLELLPEEAMELARAARTLTPRLRVKMDTLLAILARAKDDEVTAG